MQSSNRRPTRSWSLDSKAPVFNVAQEPIFGRGLRLNEIRVLKVHPAEDDGALHCTLSIHQLSEGKPQYVALSYCWGSTLLSREIICNGIPLAITESLYGVLWQSRESGDTDYLWADAICINQLDEIEKTVQVRQMKRIYENALAVHVWVGEKGEADVAGLALIERLNDIETIKNNEWDAFVEQDLDFLAHGLPSLEDPAWPSMFGILHRPWFRRKWIIQEATVNPNTFIRCGDVNMEFNNVLRAGKCLYFNNLSRFERSFALRPDVGYLIESSLFILRSARWQMQQRGHIPLLYMLATTREFHAQDARDSYFALIGLAHEIHPGIIDYRKNLREVVMDITIALIHGASPDEDGRSSPVHIISWVWNVGADQTGLKLPSWVPDFSKSPIRDISIPLWLLSDDDKEAMPGLGTCEWRVTRHKESLLSNGKNYDTITRTSDLPYTLRPGEASRPTAEILRIELEFFIQVFNQVSEACPALTLDQIERKMWRTLCCGNRLPGQPLTEADWESFQAMLKMLNYGSILIGYPIPKFLDRVPKVYSHQANLALLKEMQEAASFFLRTATTIRATRRLFITHNGHVGMSCAGIQPGDQIFFFLGNRFPLILRPIPVDSEISFEVVGDCYLDGFMNGEAHGDLSGFEQIEIL